MQFKILVVYKDKQGNQVLYTVQSENKMATDITLKELRGYFAQGTCVNATLVKGQYVRGKKDKLVFKEYIEPQKSASNSQSNYVLPFFVYTGEILKNLVSKVADYKARDFVKGLSLYSQNNDYNVVGVSGLRGTGKTTGFLQTILEISKVKGYNNIAYIVIKPNVVVTCQEIMDWLLQYNYQYVFIDEVTRIKDFLLDCSMFYDNYTLPYKCKLYLTGTESYALGYSLSKGLYHRMLLTSITFINFKEAKRTMGVNLSEYLSLGGLYKADAFTDITGMYEYINTAVIDNIVASMQRNKDIVTIDKRKLTFIVLMAIYLAVFSTMKYVKGLRIEGLMGVFELAGTEYTVQDLCNHIETLYNLETIHYDEITSQEYGAVIQALQLIGLFIRVPNKAQNEQKYYITNQCVVNVVVQDIIQTIQNMTGLQVKSSVKQLGLKGIKGVLLEALVMSHCKQVCKKYSYNLFYYRDSMSREIDIVIQKPIYDYDADYDFEYSLFEVKLTSDINKAVLKSKWINDKSLLDMFDGNVKRNIILYTGKTQVFKGFENTTDLYAPKGISIEEIEKQNFGVQLVNIQEFLEETIKYLD